MKKRKNIIISAITCLFSICLMMFGVYAATNPSVSINGQVSYTARDASILVQGKMYGADGYETGEYKTVTDPTSPQPSDVLTDSVSQYVDYTSADQNKSTMATWELGELQFYEDSNGVRDVTLSFKFTNLSKYPVVAKVKSIDATTLKNVTPVLPEKEEIYLQQNTSANNTGEMTFALRVTDDSQKAEITFSLVLEFTKLEMTTQGWSVDWYDENQDALRIIGFEGTDAQAVNIPATLSKDGKSYPVKAIGLGIDSADGVTGTEKCVFASDALINGTTNEALQTVFISEGIQEIDALSFTACTSLTDITMPDSVTNIGLGAFMMCTSLTDIQIPSSCTKIGQAAFSGAGLKQITVPNTIQSIEDIAFSECSALQTVVIPDSVTSIGVQSFHECNSLQNVNIPNSVTKIGSQAFYGCDVLKSITIPSSVTSIGDEAFKFCANLTTVNIEQKNSANIVCGSKIFGDTTSLNADFKIYVQSEDYKTSTNWSDYKDYMILGLVFDDWMVSFDHTNKTVDITGYVGDPTKTKIVVPSTIEYMDKVYHTKRVGVALEEGDSVSTIDQEKLKKYLFFKCVLEGTQPAVQDLEFENGIQEIGAFSFVQTFDDLQTLVLPQSLTTIGDAAFFFNTTPKLDSLIIPDSVTYLGTSAFFNFTVNKTFKLSSNLKEISDNAFGWSKLPRTVVIPANIERIGNGAFADSYEVYNYIFEEGSKLKTIGSVAFGNLEAPAGQIKSITIPASVESIGEQAFYQQSCLTNITFEGNLSEIPSKCFYGCQSLMSFTVPSGVTSIGDDAFEGCYRLSEIFNLSNLNITAGSSDNGKVAYYAVRVAKNTTSALESVGDYYFVQGDDGYYYLAGYNYKGSNIMYNATFTLPTLSKNYKIKRYALLFGAGWTGSTCESVVIPSCVIGIGENAFSANEVTLNCQTPPENLLDLSICNYIYVPTDSVEAYKTAEGWSAYADKIQAIA